MKQLSENLLENRRPPMGPKAAIIAIHWQYDVVAPDGALSATFAKSVGERGVIPRTAELIAYARSAGAHIVHVVVQYEPQNSPHVANNALWNLVTKSGRFLKATRGVEVVSELAPEEGDVVVYHERISAFYGSSLLHYLIGNNISDLYLSGVATNVAVDHTARDAVQYGFNTYVVEDCCASADMTFHEAALMTLRVLCTGVVTSREIISQTRPAS